MAIARLTLEDTVLLAVDFQERLLGHIENHETVTRRARLLIEAFGRLGVPILATEQYPQGLGRTVPPIAEALGPAVSMVEKVKFSASVEPVRQSLAGLGRRTVVVCGIETHVCILQTALDLATEGYVVAVAADAVGSQRRADHETALARLRQAGILAVTAEMAILEIVHEAGTERFKSIAPLLK